MNPETRFRAYLHAFNARDWNTLRGFYAPDVRLMIGNGTELAGRESIIDFYIQVNRQTRRTIEIVRCLANEAILAAEIESEFLALEHVPDFLTQPLVRGDRYYLNSFVFYEFSGEQYTRIRAATFRREFRPVASMKEQG